MPQNHEPCTSIVQESSQLSKGCWPYMEQARTLSVADYGGLLQAVPQLQPELTGAPAAQLRLALLGPQCLLWLRVTAHLLSTLRICSAWETGRQSKQRWLDLHGMVMQLIRTHLLKGGFQALQKAEHGGCGDDRRL